jgi:hypothetical protein
MTTLTRRRRDPRERDAGAGSVEYIGILLVVVVIIAAVLVTVTRLGTGELIACRIRSAVTQSGTCGAAEVPTTYGGKGGAAAPDASYANASGSQPAADDESVSDALDDVRAALDGGFWGVRGGDLDDAKAAIEALNGAEVDALVEQMSDDELADWVDELDDGWLTGGWDREQRRELWEVFATKADKATLDRLATFTDELQPAFDEVGGDGARDDPDSPANSGTMGELPHKLYVGGADPLDVAQGSIGDCWFVASMMAVAQADPTVIEQAITANPNGTYTVRLYDDGAPVDVTVTPEMVLWPDGSPAFVDNQVRGDDYELWPLVLEKALAIHTRDYAEIEGGYASEGLELLTGKPSDTHRPADFGAAEIDSVLDAGGAVALSSLQKGRADDNPLYQSDAGERRLHTGHAYYVSAVDVEAGTVTVVNPWGIVDYPPITLSMDEFKQSFREVQTNEVSG